MLKGIMATQGRRGRPCKPYLTSWGELIPGLRRERDGRWRILATRATFVEPDERLAVLRFRSMTGQTGEGTLDLRWEGEDAATAFAVAREYRSPDVTIECASRGDPDADDVMVRRAVSAPVSSTLFWSTMRRMLLENPALCAKRCGIPQLGSLADLPMPTPPLRLKKLLDIYFAEAETKEETRENVRDIFETFLRITQAETDTDLTQDVIWKYREHMRSRGYRAETIKAYFSRVKTVIRFCKSEGVDAERIDRLPSRMAILRAPKNSTLHDPTPISPEHFHRLFITAGSRESWRENYWQARLMLMLNLCLHFDEVLDMMWNELDLERNTFLTRRNKRGRVIRAATLWPITINLLRSIRRTGSPYVFVSCHGTRFNAKGQWKTWDEIREASGLKQITGPDGLPRTIQLDDIRDGAYTAACVAPGVEEKFARLLGGHRSHGLQDVYVARKPEMVKPACDAVLEAYFGPKQASTGTPGIPTEAPQQPLR